MRPLRVVEGVIAAWPMMLAVLTLSMVAESASITLRWTAPGDDSTTGRATAYDLRQSLLPISELNFASAVPVTGTVPAPSNPGTLETAVANNLVTNNLYYFAVRTRDDVGNWSRISNVYHMPGALAVGDDPATLFFSNPFPNPARGVARFFYTLPQHSNVLVAVYDVSGRMVRSLIRGAFPPGRGDVNWDLRDTNGSAVAPGVYMVRAKLAEADYTRRVVVAQ